MLYPRRLSLESVRTGVYSFGTPPTETEVDTMGHDELFTTERDALLDTVAALDKYDADFGGTDVTIEKVEPTERDTRALVTLSNGGVYELRVSAVA